MYNEKSRRPSYPSTARKSEVGAHATREFSKKEKKNNVEIIIPE